VTENKKNEIETLIDEIKSGKKYRALSPDTIRDVVTRETTKHKSLKNAVKAARKRLHLILADYLSHLDYPEAEQQLKSAFSSGDQNKIRETCLNIMTKHASTHERIEILDEFYPKLFAITGKPQKLADLACALNPLSFRWMGLPKDVSYYAFDNNLNNIAFLDLYFQLEGLKPSPIVQDILCHPPEEHFDVAFLFKMYHCLEHRQKNAGWEVIKNTPAHWLAVSFPTRTLANRKSDIFGNYKDQLISRINENNWTFQIVEFRTEKILLINKKAFGDQNPF